MGAEYQRSQSHCFLREAYLWTWQPEMHTPKMHTPEMHAPDLLVIQYVQSATTPAIDLVARLDKSLSDTDEKLLRQSAQNGDKPLTFRCTRRYDILDEIVRAKQGSMGRRIKVCRTLSEN